MKKRLQNLIIYMLGFLILIEPFFQLSQINVAKAESTDDKNASFDEENIPYNGDSAVSQPQSIDSFSVKMPLLGRPKYAGMDKIIEDFAAIHGEEDRKMNIGLEQILAKQRDPRIILNADDMQALTILSRMSGSWMMPDFNREPEAIWVQYPKFKPVLQKEKPDVYNRATSLLGHEISSVDDIAFIQAADSSIYDELIHRAQIQWSSDLGDVADAIINQTDSAIKTKSSPDSKIISTLSDVTGRTIEEINQIFLDNANNSLMGSSDTFADAVKQRYDNLISEFQENIKAIKVDIRVVNLLVYLVTPKTQGGAGHWRIKVKRILSGYTSPKKIYSRESDTIYFGGNSTDVNAQNMTAADYGQNRTTPRDNTSTVSYQDQNDPNADALVYDEDGQTYDAYIIDKALAASGNTSSAQTESIKEGEKNISAHADGQAVDISEIDDIRCTMIKKRRIGADSKSKFLQRPIKLAWQTAKGYAESGAGDYYKDDMSNVLKSFASEGIKDLVNEFGGDVTDYDGDLSSASFSDVALLLGKSIFSEIIGSPGANLEGYHFGDTLEKLGGMYLADYLGLPRDMFSEGHRYDTYDDLAQAIGAAAVEQRMNIPVGTFDGNTLQEMLLKAGQRKVETEMNLAYGSLNNYFKDVAESRTNVDNKDYLIGKAIIEQELNMEQGSFSSSKKGIPETFDALIDALGKVKADLIFRDSAYVDNMLHIPLGTTDTLKKNAITPYSFAVLVGRNRLNDTVYGFQYMAAKDASYELDEGTFKDVLDGKKEAVISVGIKVMARIFGNTNEEKLAITTLINQNLAKDANDPNLCKFSDPEKVIINAGTDGAKEVTINETKATSVGLGQGSMFELLACPTTNPRSVFETIGTKIITFAIIQQYLNPDQKIKFDLTNMNPQFHSSDPEKEFYVTRAYKIPVLISQIKNNWSGANKDPQYQAIKKAIDNSTTTIQQLFDASQPIVSIDQAKQAARNMAVAIQTLNSNVRILQSNSNRYINKVNGTLFDISELLRTVAEIMEGKPIQTTDGLRLNQIPNNIFTLNTDTGGITPALSGRLDNNNGSNKVGLVANKTTLMALFARKIKPADFFIILAADKIETSLGLPQNSLVYFVQNYEKKGLKTVESFYNAVGEAKLEEIFNMPVNYFHGPLITDASLERPDFRNDLRALYYYGDKDIEALAPPPSITVSDSGNNFKAHAAVDKITLSPKSTIINPLNQKIIQNPTEFDYFPDTGLDLNTLTAEQKQIVIDEGYIAELAWIKISDPSTFDFLVQRANKRYDQQMQQFYDSLDITNKDLETSIDDVAENVRIHKLNDAMRSPEQDILFRMAIPGEFSALVNDSGAAWASGAAARANQIDRMLGITPGSTRALFTGKQFNFGNGSERLSKKDKQILVAKMGISPTAIDKLLSYLNREIPLSELESAADDIVNIGDNPYIDLPTDDNTCSADSFTEVNGSMVSNSLVKNGWFYFDSTIDSRAKTFGSKQAAEEYAYQHKNDQLTYIDELAYGLAQLSGISRNALKEKLISYLHGETDSVLNLEGDGPAKLEQSMGVSIGTLEKLFVFTEAANYFRPLSAYKQAIGHSVVNKLITGRLFSSLGLRVDPTLFTGNEFFEIMNGNFSSLWNIAGTVIDRQLGIPNGSTVAILTAKTDNLRKCAIAEIGGSLLGKYLGTDYVSLKGNIFENFGRSKLEKTLGLPRNSFAGGDIKALINNVGVINFYLAFSYPVGSVDLNSALRAFFDPDYVKQILGYSNEFKLKKIKEYLDIVNIISLSGDRQNAYIELKNNLLNKILTTSEKALITPKGAWRNNDFSGENEREVKAYLERVDSIDDTFGLTIGTTALLISGRETDIFKSIDVACHIKEVDPNSDVPAFEEVSDPDNKGRIRWENCTDTRPGHDYLTVTDPETGQQTQITAPNGGTCECKPEVEPTYQVVIAQRKAALTPDEYIKKISTKSFITLAAYQAMDLFDFDMSEGQKYAVVGLLTHYGNWSKDKTHGYLKIYDSLATIFSLHLDAKAGFDEGTIRKLIYDPANARDTLFTQATKKIDIQLGLNPNQKWSVSGVYANYFNFKADPSQPKENKNSECGPEQAAIDAKEAELDNRQEEINDWIDQHGGFIDLEIPDNPNLTASQIALGHDITKEPGYNEMMGKQVQINFERQDLENKKNACKVNNRRGEVNNFPTGEYAAHKSGFECRDENGELKPVAGKIGPGMNCRSTGTVSWALAWQMITDYAADKIHDKIWEATKFTINMPPDDIKKFFVNGDMRYFKSALLAYSANTFIDKINNKSDDPFPVPSGMQISYDMIKLWFVPDAGAGDYAATMAAGQFFGNNTTELNQVPNTVGDVGDHGNNSIPGTYSPQQYFIDNPLPGIWETHTKISPPSTDSPALINFNQKQSEIAYGKYNPAQVQQLINKSDTQRAACDNFTQDVYEHYPNDDAIAETRTIDGHQIQVTVGQKLSECQNTVSINASLHSTMENARQDSADRFRKSAQYRMLDATLWTKDHNVYPGFSYALFEGNSKQKNIAIATYIRMGLKNGQFFGKDIKFLQKIQAETGLNIEEWERIMAWSIELFGDKPADLVMADCLTTGACTSLANLISNQSEHWFGFKIDKDYAQGLVTGITTGDWGFTSDPKAHPLPGGKSAPTLGSVFATKAKNIYANKAFTWADNQLGWRPGTAQAVWEASVKIYNGIQDINSLNGVMLQYDNLQAANKAVELAKASGNAHNLEEAMAAQRIANQDYKNALSSHPRANAATQGGKVGADKAKEIAKQGINTLVISFISDQITKYIYAMFGEGIAQFEQKFGLVPGSMAILIGAGVSFGVATGLHALFPHAFGSMGPAGLYAALAMFVVINLFGFYKTEIKCDADGYFPAIETPSMAVDSNSGIGEWDGQDSNAAQNSSIAAAQYKAKRLILDALEMHKNPIYKDTYPSQIMTGRNEDVIAVNDAITENMCSKIGLISIAGICGGNTRAGVWENPQTTTYTHIGF